ncbi:MAG: phospholipid carrier-dependent glycosyltransferase [Solirubrobacterales bacterium]|nr:phospholipid carrier-dependent glycosyltransferase [Solirubrobacterales bacterium]
MPLLKDYFTRYGRGALIALAVIVCAGFLVRAWVVINPLEDPGDDALAYRALAEALYVDGTFGYEEDSTSGPEFKTPSDWSPGAPLIYAASYYATGGVRDGIARGVEAIFGTAAIVLAFLLTARLIGPVGSRAGPRQAIGPLVAAGLVAFYPPFIHSTGALMSEPPAIFMLPFSVLAFLWADRRLRTESVSTWTRIWPWLIPGLGLGLTALIRPEYLTVCFAFGLFLLIRTWLRSGPRLSLLSALLFGLAVLIPIVPWTIHNYQQLDRVVPVSTGSGKALFTGTYYPGDGEYQQVKAELYFEQTGTRLDPDSDELEEVDPVPLFDRAARQYKEANDLPNLDRDAALGRLGRENLDKYFSEDPVGYVGMTFRKVGRMWGSGIGEAMSSPIGRAIQILLVLAGLAGLALLAWRRRWEAIAVGLPIATVTAVAALTLAPPRRNEILMTLVLPLAAVALDALVNRATKEAGTEPSPTIPAPEK